MALSDLDGSLVVTTDLVSLRNNLCYCFVLIIDLVNFIRHTTILIQSRWFKNRVTDFNGLIKSLYDYFVPTLALIYLILNRTLYFLYQLVKNFVSFALNC
jgi:hypothetical protein